MLSAPHEARKGLKIHFLNISTGLRPGPRFAPFPFLHYDIAANPTHHSAKFSQTKEWE